MRRHRRSWSGSSTTLQIGSTTAAMPPKAIDPVTNHITAKATAMCMTIWLVVRAAVTMA
jgi:hypothetical protein